MYVFYTVFSIIDVIPSNIIMDKQYYYHTFTILLFRDIFIVRSLLNHLCLNVIFFLFAYSKYNMDVMSDPEPNLDVSWIAEQQRIQNIETNYCREPVTDIQIYSLYINKNSYIDKITRKKHDIVDNVLTRDVVLGIIQNNKRMDSKKYKLMDVLVYHVDMEPQHIQTYSQTNDIPASSKSFFKVLPIVDEIHIPHSIFIFHSLSSVFFMYKEVDTGSHNHTIKSILKPSSSSVNAESKSSHTRKVRISMDVQHSDFVPHRSHKPKKTRKLFPSFSK
jgi:hypothetical protein